jgi:hypothetical protein
MWITASIAGPGFIRYLPVHCTGESVVAKPDVSRFECPNCGAKYKLVRVEADPKIINRQITCRSCGAPFHGREGTLALKYFMVDRPRVRAPANRFG